LKSDNTLKFDKRTIYGTSFAKLALVSFARGGALSCSLRGVLFADTTVVDLIAAAAFIAVAADSGSCRYRHRIAIGGLGYGHGYGYGNPSYAYSD